MSTTKKTVTVRKKKEVASPPDITPPPTKKTTPAFVSWIIIIVFLSACYAVWCFKYLLPIPERGYMNGGTVLFFALALAFFWVEVLHFGYKKPFNCIKCMAGWFALILAALFHVKYWYLYPFSGVFIGSIYEAIKFRWL